MNSKKILAIKINQFLKMRNKKKFIFSKFFSKYFIRSKSGRIILTYHSLNSNINNLTTSIYQLDPNLFIDHINYIKNNKFISRNFL